jgi:hypothetical protein
MIAIIIELQGVDHEPRAVMSVVDDIRTVMGTHPEVPSRVTVHLNESAAQIAALRERLL